MTAPDAIDPSGEGEGDASPVEHRRDGFDRAASVMYAVLLTVEALWIADVVTHGAVSRAIEPRLRGMQTWARARLDEIEHERKVRIAGRHVVFEAMTIAQEEGNR